MSATAVKRTIPLLDIAAIHEPIREQILAELTRVVDSQKFILGDDVRELEQMVAAYSGTRFAIGCASGSDALFLALLATGLQAGDRVLTTPYSFFATAGSITRAGGIPVFVDIDPVTYNIDAERACDTLRHVPGIKAVIPVHLFGACADMDPILAAAAECGCVVIEDGAQAIGAEYKERKAQSIGDIGCISFFPSKNLGGLGDGGMLLTNSEDTARKLGALRVHGSFKKYHHELIGINSRLDTIQAAALKVKLPYLDFWTATRQRNADMYRRKLSELCSDVGLPEVAPYQTRHVYNQFVIRYSDRDGLKAWLNENGIGTEVYYPLPLHLQPCYRDFGYREGDLPVSEQAARETLALPIHPALREDDIDYICNSIAAYCSRHGG